MWKYLNSSNVAAIKQENSDLLVRFKDGSTYKYYGAGYLFEDMASAASAGSFVHSRLKGNFDYAKL